MSTDPIHIGSHNLGLDNLGTLMAQHEERIIEEWIREMSESCRRSDLMPGAELRSQCSHLLKLVTTALPSGDVSTQSSEWQAVRDLLGNVSRSRATQGFTTSETATFVFSLKKPVFNVIWQKYKDQPEAKASLMWSFSQLIDSLGLYTTEIHQKSREEIIEQQQEGLLELSTPVIKLWDGVLALPIIGTLDSARTQVVMESLLQAIVQTDSRVAIIDITGVPTVDTVVAQHLLKTVTAARLMGTECIISGVRAQIAQTIVHLGINIMDVTTKATLSAAFSVALERLGITAVREANA